MRRPGCFRPTARTPRSAAALTVSFNCTLQDAGSGVDFPDPGAEPFCVEFDKTQQSITDLGILDFLANEPARVAAAVDKCFYFKRKR